MSLFGGLIGGGLSLLGGALGDDDREDAAAAALTASQPVDVRGPTGSATFEGDRLNLGLRGSLESQAGRFGAGSRTALGALASRRPLDSESLLSPGARAARETAELSRLRTLRRPEIDRARHQLQSRLLARGRLGAASADGLSGAMFNPETAALEEAIMRTDLGDIGAARDLSRQDAFDRLGASTQGRESLVREALGLQGGQLDLLQAPERLGALGIGARAPAGVAGLQAQPGFASAGRTEDFFSALGSKAAGADLPGLFDKFRTQGVRGLFL